MEIRHLRSFIAVAENLHFRRAAARIHLSQPALSVQIRALEEEIGVPLFERNRRGTKLTAAGTRLRSEAPAILARIDLAGRRVKTAAGGTEKALGLGLVDLAARLLLPLVLAQFHRDYPGVRVETSAGATAGHAADIAEGRLDLGFIRLPLDRPDLQTIELHHEPLLLFARSARRLPAGERARMEDLDGRRLVLWEDEAEPGGESPVVSELRRHGANPRIAARSPTLEGALALAAAGLGVAVLPQSAAGFASSRLATKPLEDGLPEFRLGLALPATNPSAHAQAFAATARRLLSPPLALTVPSAPPGPGAAANAPSGAEG